MKGRMIVLAVGVTLAAVGCKKSQSWSGRDLDIGKIEVVADKMNVRSDTVGEGKWKEQASFVLVDAINHHEVDADVTLGGELIDAEGNPVAELRAASLRIPAGKRRTFALIDDDNQLRPNAAGARVKVLGAHELRYSAPVQVIDGYAHPDEDGMMIAGTVVNAADRNGKVIVIGTFYDAEGVPLTRPFQVFQLAGDSSHPVEFTGPKGAVEGYIFVGQTVF